MELPPIVRRRCENPLVARDSEEDYERGAYAGAIQQRVVDIKWLIEWLENRTACDEGYEGIFCVYQREIDSLKKEVGE